MRRSFRSTWLLLLWGSCGVVAWAAFGRTYVRRRFFGPAPIPEAARTESQFLALLLPRVAPERQKYALSAADLREILGGLKKEGYVSIGLDDVADLYARRRLLPPKALLIAFAEDDSRGVALADAALRSLRLRGVDFLSRTAIRGTAEHRQHLTRHAVVQMRRGGTWDFGWIAQEAPPSVPEAGARALLDDGRLPAAKGPGSYPLRFAASQMGLDDAGDDPRALRILALRPERTARENLDVVLSAWPRTAELADDFGGDGFGADWIAGWGVASLGNGQLALLPTPRQSSAGIFLRGTETWRDVALEFELKKYQKEFWAYARYRENGGFLRVGAHGGYWYVEERVDAKSAPTLLARAPIVDDGRPARVRLVLKGGSAIVHVNGRMQFGRALHVHPSVDRGRVLFAVYDARARSAMAVLTSVRAAPLGEEWIALRRDAREFGEQSLKDLREEAVRARVVSPRWIAVAGDGGVSLDESQGTLIRSLAGFYGCRLVPTAELPPYGPPASDPARVERALSGLVEAARRVDGAGLNLRLGDAGLARPQTIAFLTRLRAALHASGRELWVTVAGPGAPAPELRAAVDGVLRPAAARRPDFDVLAAAPAPRGTQEWPRTRIASRTSVGTQREPALIQ